MNDSALANLIEAAENIPYGFVAVKSIEHGSDMIALNGEFSKICGYASKEELMAASGGVYMICVPCSGSWSAPAEAGGIIPAG